MIYYTYTLQSETSGKLYIGQTSNFEKRILRRNNGRSVYTRNRGPWKLLFSKECQTRSEAVLLEKKLKGFKNPQKVKDWINSQQKVDLFLPVILQKVVPTLVGIFHPKKLRSSRSFFCNI